MRHWQSYALSLFSFMLLVGCPTQIEPPISEDPIAAVGHGAFVGVDGKEFTPDRGFILAAQQYYIDSMIQQRGDLAVEETQELIDSLVDDEILAQALFIDWLVENIQPENTAHITAAASAMRWQYVIEFLPQLLPVDGQWSKGIDNETAERLEKVGVTVFALTDAAGEAYIGECEEAGVPIPPPMFSNAWRFEGIIENEFISAAGQAELWSYTSESPPGLCLSLPRYRISGGVVGDDAYLMGLICLGTESSKACFWDNPKCDVSKGTCFRRNVEVDISQFVGGADLVANAQGVCSDCHAGENPFVVHPDKPAFALVAETLPLAWYDPLVVPSWPQNPGPTSVLDAVSSTGKCTACHRVGSAGRFPDVSTQLPYYCSVVLQTAVGSGNTMPPPPNDKSQFTAHISALTAACSGPGTTGVVVDFSAPDDRSFVSRPLVVGPLYACATKIAVRGAILDAKVTVEIDGTMVSPVRVRNPDHVSITVPELKAGQRVTATQEFEGTVSVPSDPVVVRDHTVDFPSGLPAPDVDPALIYDCGRVIAVRHVPGATVTVFVNDTDARSFVSDSEWTNITPGKSPFDAGDSFTAEIRLCTDRSPLSSAQKAVSAPTTTPDPKFDPAEIYDEQELVTLNTLLNGSLTSVAESTFGPLGDFSTAVSWLPNYDVATKLGRPLVVGDVLEASQELCNSSTTTKTPPARPCDDLPAPRIRFPAVGDLYVFVTESVPGARIRVYDSGNNELGDSSGTVIGLNRAVTGSDTLTVIQQLGQCTSKTGYRVSLRKSQSSGD